MKIERDKNVISNIIPILICKRRILLIDF